VRERERWKSWEKARRMHTQNDRQVNAGLLKAAASDNEAKEASLLSTLLKMIEKELARGGFGLIETDERKLKRAFKEK
jgi:hypothetical protein